MEIFICKVCNKEFNGINSILRHSSLTHKISSDTVYVEYLLNGIRPKCECGCGENAPFISIGKGFSRFVKSHHNRVPGKNNFHKNPETKIKSAKTQSENWKKGLYRKWWEEDTPETKTKIEGIKEKLRNNKERGDKISYSLSGHKINEDTKKKISLSQKKRYEDNPKLKIDASERSLIRMKNNMYVKTSKLETLFIDMLESIGFKKDIHFIHNYLIVKIKTFFDFYFEEKNLIIEIDGDFYHCNPQTKYAIPKYEIQKKNISNDKRKNKYCENHNIKLLRYWEKDIIERPEWVIQDLKLNLI